MKRLVWMLLLALVPALAWGLSATTNSGYPACFQEEWLEDLMDFSISEDRESFRAYMQSDRCVMLRSGMRVTVTDGPGMFGGAVEFVFRGTKAWTLREALNYGE